MNFGIVLLLGIIYFVIGSILVYRDRFEEYWEGGVNYTTCYNVCTFLLWPLILAFYIVVAPFYGIYKLVAFIGDKITGG